MQSARAAEQQRGGEYTWMENFQNKKQVFKFTEAISLREQLEVLRPGTHTHTQQQRQYQLPAVRWSVAER